MNNTETIINIIDKKIKELDEKAAKHCFKRGKMCEECWEKKVPLMEIKEKFLKLGNEKQMKSEDKTKYEKTLQKGINLLKNNPNAIIDILQTATRLSYLRGKLFEQEKKEDLKDE